jgi:hypothetical protein
MAERSYDTKRIALEQLETALRLYLEQRDYIAAITLAGAAEEILGRIAKNMGIETSLQTLSNDAVAIHKRLLNVAIERKHFVKRANYARNKLKHVDPITEPTIVFDPEEEAIDMLNRAIENYWNVEGTLTDLMKKYQNEQGDG